MANEVIFILQTVIGLCFALVAFRLGKNWLYAYIAMAIVLANIFVTKQFDLFGLSATGGNVLYGSIFLVTDLLSEHYGKATARKAVIIGFFGAVFYLIMSQLILLYTVNDVDWGAGAGMDTIFTTGPAIILASLSAYMISQLHDIWAFHLWKKKFKGKYLWLRNNLSTFVSQAIDSIIFTSLAFGFLPILFRNPEGLLPWADLVEIIITTYLLKLVVAAIDTPFIYLSYRFKPGDLVS
ncbi:MAG: queuosine precursor transporter [Candidatus Marinimicrobia bacterium]|nr:queuosine precursor transporter [Candidatus Neomarinimicrobiota bacterium]